MPLASAQPAPPRPKPGPPPASLAPDPQRRGQRSWTPEAARSPGAGGADPADTQAPPARTRPLGTRGRDEQVPSPRHPQTRTGAQALRDSQARPRPLSTLIPGLALSPSATLDQARPLLSALQVRPGHSPRAPRVPASESRGLSTPGSGQARTSAPKPRGRTSRPGSNLSVLTPAPPPPGRATVTCGSPPPGPSASAGGGRGGSGGGRRWPP